MRRAPRPVSTAFVLVVGLLVSMPRARADDRLPPPVPRPVAPGAGSRPVAPPPAAAPAPGGGVQGPRPGAGVATPPTPIAASSSGDYRLAPGDEITIEVIVPANIEAETGNLFRTPTLVVVSNGGEVDLPKSPGVRLEGRTRGEVRADIQRNLKTAGVSAQAEVLVNVTRFATRYISVVGAVNKTIEVSPFARTTILQVFATCGDSMKDADMRSVQVNSKGRRRVIDVRAVLQSGGTSPDAYLEPDDVVIVDERPARPEPVIASVYVGGFVRAAGAYRLHDSSGQPITVLKAIFLAGGFAEFAYMDEVILRRAVGGRVEQYQLNLEKVLKGKKGAQTSEDDVVLQAGDVVFVRGSG